MRVIAVPFVLAAGCVIPPDLHVDKQDAGVNSPPAITKVLFDGNEIADPGPVSFQKGMGSITVKLVDTDVDDQLTVKVFVDYNNPDKTPARSSCPGVNTTNVAERSAMCDMGGVCQTNDIGQTRGMTIVVFDRQVLDTGNPLYQAMAPGGQSTSRFYYLKCM